MTCERHELDGRLDGRLLRSHKRERPRLSPSVSKAGTAATTVAPQSVHRRFAMSSIEARRPAAAIATSGPITGGTGQANPAMPSLPCELCRARVLLRRDRHQLQPHRRGNGRWALGSGACSDRALPHTADRAQTILGRGVQRGCGCRVAERHCRCRWFTRVGLRRRGDHPRGPCVGGGVGPEGWCGRRACCHR